MWKWLLILCVAFSANLSAQTKVLVFAGSSRADSLNKKLVAEAATIAQQMGADVTVVDLKNYPIPFYNEDLEAKEGMPLLAKQFRKLMIQNDVIFIASPEYNGSFSALLKNAIDWASRDENGGGSRDAFKGKKFALMSVSPGPGGGARGLAHLKSVIEAIGGSVITLQVAVPDGFNAFDAEGHLKNEKSKKELQKLVQSALN